MSDATEKMRREGLPDIAIDTFARYEDRLRAGEQGLVPESEIEPLAEVPPLSELDEGDASAIERVVVLKLNGGLGTSMGMTKAKSLLEVKDGHSFLDVIARQILQLREQRGARIPLLLMNSFATREDTLAALASYPELQVEDLPLDFLQGRVPKLLADGGGPAAWPADPGLEWAPPGHGDVFASLAATGLLSELLERGYEYLFLSNSDNLGATLEPRILGWLASEGLPFVSEVVDRTESDRKGGHLARRRSDGGLLLRETAQVPDDDQAPFEDIEIHSYFNANNIWVSLHALDEKLREGDGVLELPMIVNRKTVDPGTPPRPRSSSSRRRWARRSARSRAPAPCTCRASDSSPSRRRATCWWCARMPTASARTGASGSLRSATAARRTSSSTPTTTSWSATSTSASPRGRPRSPPARDSRSTGT